jgi:anti-sigma B factor antagonist
MLEIKLIKPGDAVMSGRFDASQVDTVKNILSQLRTTTILDIRGLEYISSAGLGILLAAQKNLTERGQRLRLANMSKHIRDVFKITRLETIFEIIETKPNEPGSP